MMMQADRERLLTKFNSNAPADARSVHQFETESGFKLPEDYVQFLQQTDGGEGFVGDAYLILWRVGELLEMNEGYQVAEYAPGLFLFGSDGGGDAFAFDMRADSTPIVCVPFVGMALEFVRPVAPDFHAFLKELSKS
jgi:hypothetical protein